MRVFFTSLLFIVLLSSCINPLKLLDNGEYDQAYKLSKRHLDQRINHNHTATVFELAALQDSYLELQDRAIQQITLLLEEAQPNRWLSIYPLYNELLDRHIEVQIYTHFYTDFQFRYDQPSLERLSEHARLKAGAYCLEQATSLIPAARAMEKTAAREAYGWLLDALNYLPKDENCQAYLEETRELGTVRILVQNISYANPSWNSMETAFTDSSFPLYQKDWLEIIYRKSDHQRIDYQLILEITDLDVGRDDEGQSTECFQKEVITGQHKETKQIWQDSVWVEIEEEVPTIETVSATITTVEQSKEAWGEAQIQMIPLAGQMPGKQWNSSVYVDWSNTYEICAGDERALSSSCSGSCDFYPSDSEMIHDLSLSLRTDLIQNLIKSFPAAILKRKERKALGW